MKSVTNGHDRFSRVRMIAGRAGIDVAMTAEGKKVPLQGLTVFLNAYHHFFLNRNDRGYVVGAIQVN